MSLRYKFRNAARIRRHLTDDERARLAEICTRIRAAEAQLNRAAAEKLAGCKKECQGLCCRNVIPDDLITQMDALFIWEKAPDLRPTIEECLEREGLFTADCFFLKAGVGPCIFPGEIRPEKCLITFCADSESIHTEIRNLRSAFSRMYWFILFQNLRTLFRSLFQRKPKSS